jgi:hypothetical protein
VKRHLALLAIAVLSAPAYAAPTTWSVNGHQYEVIRAPGLSWNAARAAAQALGPGWDLATITSAGEQNFIASLLGPPPSEETTVQYWVGGFQPTGSAEPGGNWQWINGEGMFWNNGSVGAFSAWGPNEPDNLGGQNYLALDNRFGWGWDDNGALFQNVVYGFVAERSRVSVPEPATLALVGLGLAGISALRRRKVD